MEGCFAALTIQTLENDMTTRQIKLTYVDTGEFALADLLDSEAPKTCARVWTACQLNTR